MKTKNLLASVIAILVLCSIVSTQVRGFYSEGVGGSVASARRVDSGYRTSFRSVNELSELVGNEDYALGGICVRIAVSIVVCALGCPKSLCYYKQPEGAHLNGG